MLAITIASLSSGKREGFSIALPPVGQHGGDYSVRNDPAAHFRVFRVRSAALPITSTRCFMALGSLGHQVPPPAA